MWNTLREYALGTAAAKNYDDHDYYPYPFTAEAVIASAAISSAKSKSHVFHLLCISLCGSRIGGEYLI